MKLNNLLTIFIFLFFSTSLIAKKGDKVPGYVTLNNGDKLEGNILVGSITDNETKVVFYKENSDKKTIYKPKDLLGYGFEEKEIDLKFGMDNTSFINDTGWKPEYSIQDTIHSLFNYDY